MAPPLTVLSLLLLLVQAIVAAASFLSLAPGVQFYPTLTWSIPSPASSVIVNAYSSRPYGPFSIFAPILSSASFNSRSKGFSFGFLSVFDHPSNVSTAVHIYLAVCLGTGQVLDDLGRGFALPVWVANQNQPLSASQQGVVALTVDSQRNLALTAANGSVIWAVRDMVASMEVRENGDLVIYDSRNDTLWQSFDEPQDVLVQGQALPVGAKIVSMNSMYVLDMRTGGVVVYLQSSSAIPLAYFTLYLNQTVQMDFSEWLDLGTFTLPRKLPVNFTAAVDSPADPPSPICTSNSQARTPYAVLLGSNFTLLYGEGCPSDVNVSWPIALYFQNHVLGALYNSDLIRLDTDGIPRGYTFLSSHVEHQFSSDRANFTLCFSPNTCGPQGICSPFTAGLQHDCRCPSSGDNAGFANAFVEIDPLDASQGCRRTVPLQCEAGANQSLVPMEHATFISFRAIFEVATRSHPPTPLSDCVENCASNCSCSGLYYHTPSSFCLPFSEDMAIANLSLMSLYSEDYVTYFKIQQPNREINAPFDKPGRAGPGNGSKGHFLLAFIVGGTLLLACIMTVLAFFVHKRLRRNKQYFIDENDPELQEILPTLPARFSYRELRKATGGFKKIAGKGAFGTVFEGALPDSRRVAVKRLEMILPQLKPFLTEVATIGSISHFNIVRLYGYCSERLHRLLVYEYMENGSLDRWLFMKDNAGATVESSPQHCQNSNDAILKTTGSRKKASDVPKQDADIAIDSGKNGSSIDKQQNNVYSVLSWKTRYAIALGTARALAYLHEESPRPIIHFDVKPENILLDSDFVPKLSDFGLAKLVERGASAVFTLVRGTAGYMAPEWLSHSLVSKKCDVYSYGMVLLELVGGRRNADPVYASTDQWYFPKWAATCCREGSERDLVDKRLQGVYDFEQLRKVLHVAFLCIHKEPTLRPSMSTVCKLLEGSLSSTTCWKGTMDTGEGDQPSLDHILHETLAQFDNYQGTASEESNACKSSPISLYSSIQGR